MRRQLFIDRTGAVEGFTIVEQMIGKAHEGITPELLRNLWDIIAKWGARSTKGMGLTSPNENGFSIEAFHFSHRNDGGGDGFSIAPSRRSDIMLVNNSCMFSLKNGMQVMWDLTLDPSDVLLEIAAMDDLAEANSLKRDGERVAREDEIFQELISQEVQGGGLCIGLVFSTLPSMEDVNEAFSAQEEPIKDLLKRNNFLNDAGYAPHLVCDSPTLTQVDDGKYVILMHYRIDPSLN
ncbi:MAG: hypothetical protein K0S20_737 [Patescibacteria group bacterium]|nr:hypothetical protein [Patescibacteria group bacterium]